MPTLSPTAAAARYSTEKPSVTLEHVCIAISHRCPLMKASDLANRYYAIFESCNRRDVELFAFALEVGFIAGRAGGHHDMANRAAVRAILKPVE